MSQAFTGIGTQLQRGDDSSPQQFDAVPEVTSVRLPKGTINDVDVTNFDSVGGYTEYIQGLREGGEVAFEGNYLPDDQTLSAIESDFDGGQTPRAWRVAFSQGSSPLVTYGFDAYVKSFEIPITPKDAVKYNGVLKISGPVARV